ncbi:MAG: GtrA family protein, partial [Actinomycetes bacterium]
MARLEAALVGVDAEVLFVDDSTDSTPDQVQAIAATSSVRVQLLHRSERVGGLGGAVLAGLRASRADWAVVMDGDLQHPPEVVLQLLRAGIWGSADLVVASRYQAGGSASGLSSAAREWASGGATRVARAVFPRRLAGLTDPMSGFFAIRRGSVDLDRLRPRGFKILLEIAARSYRLRVVEVPFELRERRSGASKASWREGLLLARQLPSLRLAALFGRHSDSVAKAVGFAVVGASGIVVNSLALWLLVGTLGGHLLVGATLATQVSTAWNYLLTDRLVFPGSKDRSGWSRFLGFALVNNAVLLARLPLLSLLVHQIGIGYLLANASTLVAAFAMRYLISDLYLFRSGATMTVSPDLVQPRYESSPSVAVSTATRPASRKERRVELLIDLRDLRPAPRPTEPRDLLPFRYDVHGIVTIGSAVVLKELETFRTRQVHGPLDIEVRPGTVGDGGLRRRARVTQYSSPVAVSYEEHLGRHGSDFRVDMTDQIQVTAGPMLVHSPHVLYTNIIEALLRFVMVSRGYMLLHSACLELEGRGVMLSALTDTGKTGTILRLLRENRSRFLSDDMTILGPDGLAQSYPKPLTISEHTLRAVNAGDLSTKEWRKLRLQSRLHSRAGRGIGARLGELNVPIMSLNAFTQYVVPPPKFAVDRLVG